MMLTNGYYYWKKGEKAPLTPHFSTWEFTCKCSFADCVKQKISKELVDKLEAAHLLLNMPMLVTSGYRCHKKQLNLAANGYETAKGVSQHELGNAADVHTGDPQRALTVFTTIFKAIGVAKYFIHVDLRADKERRWSYYHS